MQQFVVPQFIDVEDKIIGPISTRQFIIMVGGGLLIFICYKIFAFYYFAGATLLVIVLVTLFAFIKINGRPFHYFLINMIETLKKPNLRLWSKELTIKELEVELGEKGETTVVKEVNVRRIISGSHLSELALIVDTGGVYQGEEG